MHLVPIFDTPRNTGLLSELITVMEERPLERLVDPFFDGTGLFLDTGFDNYLLNSCDPNIIRFFTILKFTGTEFIDYCEQYFTQSNNDPVTYHQFRDKFNKLNSGEEKAALSLYLNRHCHVSALSQRYHPDYGDFLISFGNKKEVYFPREELELVCTKLEYVEITFQNKPFTEVYRQLLPSDTVYCNLLSMPNMADSEHEKFVTYIRNGSMDMLTPIGTRIIVHNTDTSYNREIYRYANRIYSFPDIAPDELIAVYDITDVFDPVKHEITNTYVSNL